MVFLDSFLFKAFLAEEVVCMIILAAIASAKPPVGV
jgi:hypothetical protein